MEFGLLLEHERLEAIGKLDGRYHLAMLVAQGFNGGAQVVWDERNAWRSSLTKSSDSPPQLTRDEHMALALSIEQRLRNAGIIVH